MSVDEDHELRDLVSQTLESNGILAKIRAELRASVFLALEEHDAFKDKSNIINKALKEFVCNPEGAIVICLIREFLEFYGLEFTLAVFDPETRLGHDYEYAGRNELAKDLKLKNVKTAAPLLTQVIQNTFNFPGNDGNELSQLEVVSANEYKNKFEEKSETKSPLSESNILSTGNNVDGMINLKTSAVNGSINIYSSFNEKIFDNETDCNDSTTVQPNNVSQPLNLKKPDSLKIDVNQTSNKSFNNNSLSSLGGLPPIASFTNTKMGNNFLGNGKLTQKDVSNEIKSFLDNGLSETPDNNYEEDFHSTASEKSNKKGLISASGSEVEEEISSVGDDHTSISGGADEYTIDTTISKISDHGDYLENI